MINLYDVLFFSIGELYISKPQKENALSFHCIYSFAPSGNYFITSFYKEDVCIDTPDFDGLIQYLNYDNNKLKETFSKLTKSIIFQKDVEHCVKNFKNELMKTSPFFHFNTEYYIYDFLMTYFIDIYSNLLWELNKTPDIQSFQIENFSKQQQKLFKNVFGKKSISSEHKNNFDILSRYYNQILIDNMEMPECYASWCSNNTLNEIFDIKTFIMEEMPKKAIETNSEDWQLFLFLFSQKYETVFTIPPYTLTNHAKIENIKEYKKLLSQDNFLMSIIRDIPKSSDSSHIFKQSKEEHQRTYSILSFNDYIIAEITELWNQDCTIKFCPTCGQFYAYRNKILEHKCAGKKYSQTDINKIHKIYKNTERNHKEWFKRNIEVSAISEKEKKELDKNLPIYRSYSNDFMTYHQKVYQTAIQNHLSPSAYEIFIGQKHYCFKILKKASDKLRNKQIIFNSRILLNDRNDVRLRALADKSSEFDILMNPLPDIHSYIKSLRRRGLLK